MPQPELIDGAAQLGLQRLYRAVVTVASGWSASWRPRCVVEEIVYACGGTLGTFHEV